MTPNSESRLKPNRVFLAALLLATQLSAAEYAPYVMVDAGERMNVVGELLTKGDPKAVTLAFLGTDGHCAVGWRGFGQRLPADRLPGGDGSVASLVQVLQSAGIRVIISFGGWMGADPAAYCESPEALQAVYQQVLDLYHVTALDLDIEGPAVTDMAAQQRRNLALLALKKAHPEVTISFTLPVRPHGIAKGNGIEILQSARDAGYSPDIVNLMTMDYFYDPGSSSMARLSFRGMDNAARQLREMGLASKLGMTPMIGQNDTRSEIFTLEDAAATMDWLRHRPDIVRIAMWSVQRDNGGCKGERTAKDDCSGLEQKDWAFSEIFNRRSAGEP
jgi:hypothetical protein